MTDPWLDIATPTSSASLHTRRVSSENRFDFFWGKDHFGRVALVLLHDTRATPSADLPRPRGIHVELKQPSNGRRALLLKLLDTSQRDIFLKLSHDIIEAAETRETEAEALLVTLARTWRWHHLLRGGGNGKLGPDEQKGLIGELLVLRRCLLPKMPHIAAIQSWKGPVGAPKDFEIGRLAIEVKARRGAATPFVLISSEHQLDASGCDCLLLKVFELDQVPRGADLANALSLTSIVYEIRQTILSPDRAAMDLFEASLMSSGVVEVGDYVDDRWLEGRSCVYEVRDEFPRIVPRMTGLGVRSVQYALNLVAAEPFVVQNSQIAAEIERQGYVCND